MRQQGAPLPASGGHPTADRTSTHPSLSCAARAVLLLPAAVAMSPEGKLGRSVGWLREQGLSEAQIRGTILRYPNITSLSILDNLEVTKALLCQELGCPQASVVKVRELLPMGVSLLMWLGDRHRLPGWQASLRGGLLTVSDWMKPRAPLPCPLGSC